MTHPRLSGSSEPLQPNTVTAQRTSYTLHSIVQSQGSHSHSLQGSHSHGDLLNPANLPHPPREQRCSQSQLPVSASPWQSETLNLWYVERMGAPHSLTWVPSPCQPSQPFSNQRGRHMRATTASMVVKMAPSPC